VTSVVWGTSASGFSSQDQQSLTSAIKNTLTGSPSGRRFTIINAQNEQQWALLSLNERTSASAAPIATEPEFYLAHQTGTNWTVWSSASAGFCGALQSAPVTLLDEGDKRYFLGCYPALATTLHTGGVFAQGTGIVASQMSDRGATLPLALTTSASGLFHLPVLPGATVTVSQGNNDLQHDHNGAQRYAFDFIVGQQHFTITAAQSGRVIGANDQSTVQCDGLNHESAPQSANLDECWAHANFVLIANNDGTTAQLYMHLLPGSLLVQVGEEVTLGQPLAKAGTTGWSTGTHLHFQVEPVPTPQADPYTGWWWRPTLPVTFDDPAVVAQDANGIPLEGQGFTEGGSPIVAATPTPGLPAGTIKEFRTPTLQGDPFNIVVGPDGNLWFTEDGSSAIGRITPGGVITEFPTPTSQSFPDSIVVGPDGNLWFTAPGASDIHPAASAIGRITSSGVITEFPTPTPHSAPFEIVVGTDGNLWFTENNASTIGRITPRGGITEFPTPTPQSFPFNIVVGPDGNLWFTETGISPLDGASSNASAIGRITPGGVITEFPTPTLQSYPGSLVVGPDGNLWFTDGFASAIGRITPNGVITEFPTPIPQSAPDSIVVGPDGNLWFTQDNPSAIGRITSKGVITEFPTPTPNSSPTTIVVGPDGNLWFTEDNAIGRITPGGVTTEFLTPTPQSVPVSIVVGPDGNLWFTQSGAIERIRP